MMKQIRISQRALTQLLKNADGYAVQMVADYGVEGAKEIAREVRLNRCPECKTQRSDEEFIANRCPNCGDLGLPF
jgi:hypothetical protein